MESRRERGGERYNGPRERERNGWTQGGRGTEAETGSHVHTHRDMGRETEADRDRCLVSGDSGPGRDPRKAGHGGQPVTSLAPHNGWRHC